MYYLTVVICNIFNLYTQKKNLFEPFLIEKSIDNKHIKNSTKEILCFYHIVYELHCLMK